MVRSAMARRSSSDVESAVRPIIIISPRIDDCGPSIGVPTLSGISSATDTRRSDTICLARNTSVPQSNSTHTTEKPVVDDERTRLTSVAPFTAVSIGYVTIFSTSSGAMPGASVMTTTVGALRSGKISTSVRVRVITPATSATAVNISTVSLFLNEKFIILFSMSCIISRYKSIYFDISRF